ncbi:MAG: transposase [Sandarakinorhabdus sp.]|nr:transposase [Sandarakinorhabdus sp.]
MEQYNTNMVFHILDQSESRSDCLRSAAPSPCFSAFSPFLYRCRNLVERCFNKLKHFRAIATRYDKRDDNFLASIRIWLRHNESVS